MRVSGSLGVSASSLKCSKLQVNIRPKLYHAALLAEAAK